MIIIWSNLAVIGLSFKPLTLLVVSIRFFLVVGRLGGRKFLLLLCFLYPLNQVFKLFRLHGECLHVGHSWYCHDSHGWAKCSRRRLLFKILLHLGLVFGVVEVFLSVFERIVEIARLSVLCFFALLFQLFSVGGFQDRQVNGGADWNAMHGVQFALVDFVLILEAQLFGFVGVVHDMGDVLEHSVVCLVVSLKQDEPSNNPIAFAWLADE